MDDGRLADLASMREVLRAARNPYAAAAGRNPYHSASGRNPYHSAAGRNPYHVAAGHGSPERRDRDGKWTKGDAEHPDVKMHLTLSQEALSQGRVEAAVSHLDAAISKARDPDTAALLREVRGHLTGGAKGRPAVRSELADIWRLAGTNPEPIGKPGGPGIWGTGKQLPTLFQHVRNELMAKGTPESEAHQLAYGIIRDWAQGHDGHGNQVSAATKAEAVKALAQLESLRAEAKATRSVHRMDSSSYSLDPTWDGSLDDVPDLNGVSVADLDAAAADDPDHRAWAAADDASRSGPPLGAGGRFAALKAKLAAKGASDPEALAAKIGRAKYGKGKFGALAAKARSKAAPPAAAGAVRGAWAELFRYWPLEECKILDRSDGGEFSSGRVVEAYAAVYGQPAEIRDHQGHYEEDIDRAAFDDTLRVIHPKVNGGYWRATCLYNHGMTVHGTPAERFSLPAGVPIHISSEGKGLLTRTEYAPTPLGDELLELVNMGALRSQSFTGGIIRSNPALRGPGDRYRRIPGGSLQRVTRLQLGLREYGLTPFAAYSGAEVLGVRMQLPGGLTTEPDWDDTGDAAAPADDGSGPGDSPADESAARSTGYRLYQLRTQELLEQHGITLPDRD